MRNFEARGTVCVAVLPLALPDEHPTRPTLTSFSASGTDGGLRAGRFRATVSQVGAAGEAAFEIASRVTSSRAAGEHMRLWRHGSAVCSPGRLLGSSLDFHQHNVIPTRRHRLSALPAGPPAANTANISPARYLFQAPRLIYW